MSRCWKKPQMLILFDFCGAAETVTPQAQKHKMAEV